MRHVKNLVGVNVRINDDVGSYAAVAEHGNGMQAHVAGENRVLEHVDLVIIRICIPQKSTDFHPSDQAGAGDVADGDSVLAHPLKLVPASARDDAQHFRHFSKIHLHPWRLVFFVGCPSRHRFQLGIAQGRTTAVFMTASANASVDVVAEHGAEGERGVGKRSIVIQQFGVRGRGISVAGRRPSVRHILRTQVADSGKRKNRT